MSNTPIYFFFKSGQNGACAWMGDFLLCKIKKSLQYNVICWESAKVRGIANTEIYKNMALPKHLSIFKLRLKVFFATKVW